VVSVQTGFNYYLLILGEGAAKADWVMAAEADWVMAAEADW